MNELDQFIDRARHLPPAPQILPKLMKLLQDTDAIADDVVTQISYDPSLTASVLRLCNSAFFGAATPAADLQEAVFRIGYQPIYQIVAAVSSSRAFSSTDKDAGEKTAHLWQHSVTSAVAAQLIAKDRGDNDSEVFTCTLLHDIGKLVLSEVIGDYFEKLKSELSEDQTSNIELEKRLFSVHHAEIGGRLLERWHFPAHMIAAVWHHHDPSQAGEHNRWAAYAYTGNLMAHLFDKGFSNNFTPDSRQAEVLALLELQPDGLSEYLLRIVEKLDVIGALVHVNSGPANG